jgi:hypothetical protein
MSINQITPEAIYRQLGSLVAELPDLLEVPVKPATHVWLGRVGALVEAMGDGGKIAAFQVAVRSLHGILQEESAAQIIAAIYQTLGKAEFLAPLSAKGAFIAAGHTFDAFAAVGKAMSEAKQDVFLLDKYADSVALTDYAILASEKVSIRLLAKNGRKDLLKPAMDHWRSQFGGDRPLQVRLAPEHALHDRAIFVDKKSPGCWDSHSTV